MAAEAETKKDEAQQNEGATEEKKESGGLKAGFNKLAGMAKVGAQHAKEAAIDAKEKLDERLTMEGQLKQAAISLGKFLNPELPIEEQIPVVLMKDAKGIVFISSLKVSMGFGGSVGSGVIISKLEYGNWSGPCSIGLLGGQWGFNIG